MSNAISFGYTNEEIKSFVLIWDHRDNYPTTIEVMQALGLESRDVVLTIASKIRGLGYAIKPRNNAYTSDDELIQIWNDIDNYPSVASISAKTRLKPRWISIRMCELRAIHGIEKIPYRSLHAKNQKTREPLEEIISKKEQVFLIRQKLQENIESKLAEKKRFKMGSKGSHE